MEDMLKEMKVVSRVAFCSSCYKNNRPQDGTFFTVYGGASNRLYFHRYDAPSKRSEVNAYIGFTPHFFMIESPMVDGIYEVLTCCGIEGCDVEWLRDGDGRRIKMDVKYAKRIQMNESQWDALVRFTDSGLEL